MEDTNKALCVCQDAGERSSEPTRDAVRLTSEHPGASGGGVCPQQPVLRSEALTTADSPESCSMLAPFEGGRQYPYHSLASLKDELPRSVGDQYATVEKWRNNSRKNKKDRGKAKQHAVVDVTGNGSKVRCFKEQYCIRTWDVRSINQGKLEVVKEKMARVNIDILGISELK